MKFDSFVKIYIYITLPTIIDSKEGISEITHIFKNKYEALYTSVPTSDTELSSINAEIDNRINCYNNNNNNNNCLKSNIQCIEIRVQWTVHLGSSHMHVI